MSGRCKCCDIKLFEHEMKEENDVCVADVLLNRAESITS